ncbi:MAG: hypothetical protein Q7R35_08255 [Elusimicrobiota bacterium]|nr:hypothetical protein [Elusimicrobiota bacterium]
MKKTIYCALTLSLTANLCAMDLNKMTAVDIKGASALDLPVPAAQSAKAAPNNQRIWFTMRSNSSGWNTLEASDPFSRIEVGLRKIFDREYDVEMRADNGRETGRVRSSFTDRYELRAGRTSLRLQEWAGDYTIEGEVAVEGATNGVVRVKLDMRKRFDDFSYYIRETGIYLLIDKRDISGTVDTTVYPKKVVAAITALIMTARLENPAQGNPQAEGK